MITGSGGGFTLELMALHTWMSLVPLKTPAANTAQLPAQTLSKPLRHEEYSYASGAASTSASAPAAREMG